MIASKRTHGVHYEVHGRGFPLILGYPIMASGSRDDPGNVTLQGYLDRLTDRYRVLVMDYPNREPNAGRSKSFPPAELTAQRVCDDILAVADAAGFERFVWWGFSWGGVIGLQLAARSERVAALICGGWPPLGGAYADLLRALRAVVADSSPGVGVPADQFLAFYESVQSWPEAEHVERIKCPKITFVGSADVVELGGVEVQLAATIRERRADLEQQGWRVAEIPGADHSVYKDPGTVVPLVRHFLDANV